MAKKDPTRTPNSTIRATLRQLTLRSRERATVLKECGYTCTCCNRKRSTAKVIDDDKQVRDIAVHHDPQIDWEGLIELIRARLLDAPQTVLCKDCHDKEHLK